MLQEQKSNIVRQDDKRASHIFAFCEFFFPTVGFLFRTLPDTWRHQHQLGDDDDDRLFKKKNQKYALYSPPDSCQNDSFPPPEMTKTHDKTCRTRDSSPDICGAQSAAVCRLFILPRRALSLCAVIYSRSPQNRTDSSSSSCIPSDPSPPFQLAAGRGREKRCRD